MRRYPREEHNIGEMYEWVIGLVLKAAEQYKASLARHPNHGRRGKRLELSMAIAASNDSAGRVLVSQSPRR